MAIAELYLPETERGVLTPEIWCNKSPQQPQPEPYQLPPSILECEIHRIPIARRNAMGVVEQIDRRLSFEMFRADCEEGLSEAIDLFNYSEEIPEQKIHSSTPGAMEMKIRTAWGIQITDTRDAYEGWYWVNYANPDLYDSVSRFANWIKTPEFKQRYVKGDTKGNRERALDYMDWGNTVLVDYMHSFETIMSVDYESFTRVIKPHWEHCMEHFFLDRPGLEEESAKWAS